MIQIVKYRYITYIISGTLFAMAVFALLLWGLKPGIDFTGGSLIELNFQANRPNVDQVQETLAPLNLGGVTIQPSGEKNIILKMRFINEEEHQKILSAIRAAYEKDDNSKVIENSINTIGASVSQTMRQRSVWAVIAVVTAIVFFLAYAFRKVSRPVKSWKYGVAAAVALLHDVGVTAGVFAVLGHFYGVEVDVPFVVALLTILGYSVHDTIVVFDRTRENLLRHGTDNFAETVNGAVNQTLHRSINTSVATLLSLVALYFFGGATIHFFALALIIGIFFGTYSSIFLASMFLVSWQEWDRKRAEA
jgi:preprotein translocase subunit SecF